MKKSTNTYSRIALCESWAEHIGRSFAHKTYGNSNSLTDDDYNNYLEWLEVERNEQINHIPIGLYYDLADGINPIESANDFDNCEGPSGIIQDNISGISIFQLFSLLNANITSPNDFRTALINSGFVTNSNAAQDINNLFNSY